MGFVGRWEIHLQAAPVAAKAAENRAGSVRVAGTSIAGQPVRMPMRWKTNPATPKATRAPPTQ